MQNLNNCETSFVYLGSSSQSTKPFLSALAVRQNVVEMEGNCVVAWGRAIQRTKLDSSVEASAVVWWNVEVALWILITSVDKISK